MDRPLRARARARADTCARERPRRCIVMRVDKAIRRHVLRMLHACAELCTWHRTDRWTPCRFHFPPLGRRTARGVPAGLSVPLFFSGFLPLFSGASGFRVAVFLRSFRYSRVLFLLLLLLLLLLPPCVPRPAFRLFSAPLPPLSLSLSLSLSLARCVYRNLRLSSPFLFTLVLSLPPADPFPLSLYFFWLLLLFFVNHRLPRCTFVLFSELCHGHQIDLRCLNACSRRITLARR